MSLFKGNSRIMESLMLCVSSLSWGECEMILRTCGKFLNLIKRVKRANKAFISQVKKIIDSDMEPQKLAKYIAHKRIEIVRKFNLSSDLILENYTIFKMIYKQRYENYPIGCSVKEVEKVESTKDLLKSEDIKLKPTKKENVKAFFLAVMITFCLLLLAGVLNNGMGFASDLYVMLFIISLLTCFLSSVVNYALEVCMPSLLMKFVKC